MCNVEVEDSVKRQIEETCEIYSLDVSEVLSDLVVNYLDELIKSYGLRRDESNSEPYPFWSEECLNALGMSKRDF